MYLRVFHKVKKEAFILKQRVIGLLRYIYDYKIVLFSSLYIFVNSLLLFLLRNINQRHSIGLVSGGVLSLFFLPTLVLYRKWRMEISKAKQKGNSQDRASFKFCILFTLLSISTVIAIGRIVPIINRENRMEESAHSFTNGSTNFNGYIVEEIEEKHTSLQIRVKLLQDIYFEDSTLRKNDTILLVRLPPFYNLSIGQVCNFTGILSEPKDFEDFSYKEYLKNQNIFLIMENPKISCQSIRTVRKGSVLRNSLVDLKLKLIGDIDDVLNEPQSSLLAGILFGQKRLFSKDFEESSRVSGVSHIVAASGYNVTILMLAVNRLLFFLPKKLRTVASIVVIWLFTLLSGLSASIVRATVMSTISMVGIFFGRASSIHTTIAVTIFIFLVLDPLAIFDTGFLLSLSAVLGLVYILPILEKIKKRLTKSLSFINEYILPTMSCTISTLPVSLLTFRTFSVWSIPANALILPVVESTMLFGVLALLLKHILPSLSYLCFTVVNVQLKYFETLIDAIRSLNWGVVSIEQSVARVLSISLLLLLILSVIYLYPIKNERYNYYLRDN